MLSHIPTLKEMTQIQASLDTFPGCSQYFALFYIQYPLPPLLMYLVNQASLAEVNTTRRTAYIPRLLETLFHCW